MLALSVTSCTECPAGPSLGAWDRVSLGCASRNRSAGSAGTCILNWPSAAHLLPNVAAPWGTHAHCNTLPYPVLLWGAVDEHLILVSICLSLFLRHCHWLWRLREKGAGDRYAGTGQQKGPREASRPTLWSPWSGRKDGAVEVRLSSECHLVQGPAMSTSGSGSHGQ